MTKRWGVWLAIVVGLSIASLLVIRKAKEVRHTEEVRYEMRQCERALRQIYAAILRYADSHQGLCPADLENLVESRDLTKHPPSIRVPQRMSDYVLLMPNMKIDTESPTPIVEESEANHGGIGVNVLLANGEIKFVPFHRVDGQRGGTARTTYEGGKTVTPDSGRP